MSAEPQSAAELQPGQVFEGKYKILRELGRGGFGMVYLAFQEGMDRHVALKVLKSSVTQQAPSAKERFLREVKIISKLKHPNTVTIHDFGETYDGGLYMVLEFVEGETLKQVLKREGAQDSLRAADLARQIARSLSEAHRHGVVHRDLKPANIMITSIEADKDFVKVLDFGVARLLDPKTNDLTSVGLPEGERELIGTPRYMSPEQVRGESLTGASDIYGLGLILYEMLCGEPAVQGDTTMGLITQQISPEPLKLVHLPHFPPALQDIIRIATSKQLSDRFQTAEQMADALENCLFQIRRDRNMTGPQSGDVPMSSYQSQLSGGHNSWLQQGSGWNGNTPSGQWMPGSGPHDQFQSGGFDPRQSFQGPQSGFGPQQVPHPAHSSQMGPMNPHPSQMGPYQSQQMPMAPNPYQSGMGQGPFQSHQSMQSPFASGFNEIGLDLPEDEFQPTVERDALDPSHIVRRAQGLFDRNQHPSSELGPELPPVPVDERPFEVQAQLEVDSRATAPLPVPEPRPEPRPAPGGGAPRPRVQAPDDDLAQFSIGVIKACIVGTMALVFCFMVFLVVGAWFASFLDGTMRLIGAVLVALAFPGITAVMEGSTRERFRVVTSPVDRISQILLKTTVFSIAAIAVLSAVFATPIVTNLQNDPNWYLQDQEGQRGFPALNKRVSYTLADVIGQTMGAIGIYKKKPRGVASPGAVAPVMAPGRSKALPASTRKGNEQLRSTREDAPKSEIPEESKESKRYVDW